MKQNGVVCWPGPALSFLLFEFQYLISGPKSYRDFVDTGSYSNPGPPDYECKALTTIPRCLLPFDYHLCITISVVWLQRLQCHGLG